MGVAVVVGVPYLYTNISFIKNNILMTKDKETTTVKVASEKNSPVLIGKVFNGTIQVIGGVYENESAAKQALKGRKADGVFVSLPVLEL